MQSSITTATSHLTGSHTISRSQVEENIDGIHDDEAEALTAQAKIIGDVETTADGQVGVVVAATIVGYVPPAGLMVQVQLEPRENVIEQAAERRAERIADGEAVAEQVGFRSAVRDLDELTQTERAELRETQARDASVRREEQAHAAAAGTLAGAIQYEYAVGPDGRRYVVNGRVPINGSAASGDPEASERLGRRLSAAALSAQAPSGADLAAAAEGYRIAGDARRDAVEAANRAVRTPFAIA